MSGIPAAEMGASGLPGRGLCYARPVLHDGNPAIEALCDCATRMILRLDPSFLAGLDAPREFAFTCDGCGSAHWLTIYPTAEAPDA
jgi:hypothetical protein